MNADLARYEAKEGGRGQDRVFKNAMTGKGTNAVAQRPDRCRPEHGEFTLYYKRSSGDDGARESGNPDPLASRMAS